jgi:hypothetical protein
MNIKLLLLCPIPEDQKPINEYIELKETSQFQWTCQSKTTYNSNIIRIFLQFFVLFGIINLTKVKDLSFLFNWTIQIGIFAGLGVLLVCFIALFRWNQLKEKFENSRLFYEESSWFDCQYWEKPLLIIKNDRLLVTQKIQPILRRLGNTIFLIINILLVFFLFFEI